MKKIILSLLVIGSLSYGKGFNYIKFSKKISKNIDRTVKVVKNSKYIKELPDIKLPKGISKEVATITKVASKIAKKGDFESKLVATTAHPSLLITQYAKYGDNYLDTIKIFSKRALNVSQDGLSKIKKKFKDMPTINFKTSKEFNDKFIEATKLTGKKGLEVSKKLAKFAKENPKSSIVSAMMAWYAYDPNSFLAKKEELLNYLTSTLKTGVEDATKVTLEASGGIVDGIVNTIKEKATVSNIIGIVIAIILFILWKFRSFFKEFLNIKLENRLQKEREKNRYSNNDEEGTF